MTTLWIAGASMEAIRRACKIADRQSNRSLLANADEYYGFLRSADWFRPIALQPDVQPVTPRLRIPDPNFDFDFVHANITLVSRRLRDALALAEDAVSYGPVDDLLCPKPVRAMEYRTMEVLRTGEPVDADRSDGEWTDPDPALGIAHRAWRFPTPHPNRPAARIAWLEGFVPPAPLFRKPLTPWLLATEELAGRVMATGVRGLWFQDVVSPMARRTIAVRQPDGSLGPPPPAPRGPRAKRIAPVSSGMGPPGPALS